MKAPLVSCVLALCALRLLADEKPLPSGGVSLIETGEAPPFKASVDPALIAPAEIVDVSGQSFKQALRLKTLAATPTPYTIQLYAKTLAPIHAGDVMFVRFYLRGVETKSETGAGS